MYLPFNSDQFLALILKSAPTLTILLFLICFLIHLPQIYPFIRHLSKLISFFPALIIWFFMHCNLLAKAGWVWGKLSNMQPWPTDCVACQDFRTFSDTEGFVTCQRYYNLRSAPVEQESVRDNLGLVTDEPNVPWNTTRTEFHSQQCLCTDVGNFLWSFEMERALVCDPLQKLQRIQIRVPVS